MSFLNIKYFYSKGDDLIISDCIRCEGFKDPFQGFYCLESPLNKDN